jgi:hypothetical protein
MRREIRVVAAVDHPCLREGAHVVGSVCEEDIEILEDEVECLVVRVSEDLWGRCFKQLDCEADGRLEVAKRWKCIRGDAYPRGILTAGEEADLQFDRQVAADAEKTMNDTMGLQKNRS